MSDLLDGCEILMDEPMASRGRAIMQAMAGANSGAVVTAGYQGRHKLLMMYGAGLDRRMEARRQHMEKGGRVVTWDLGYWERESAMRLAIDSLHPTAEQMALAPDHGQRFNIQLREDADLAGPVLLVGLGRKSAALYGLHEMDWERKALERIRKALPGRKVHWRPKGSRPQGLSGTVMSHGTSIDEALRGCSLVVCRHSNVAVDACAAGVPVKCEDGAALALYQDNQSPSREQRAEFLRRLGWWCWRPSEASEAWNWIKRVTQCA